MLIIQGAWFDVYPLDCPAIDHYTVLIKIKGKAPEPFPQKIGIRNLGKHHGYCNRFYLAHIGFPENWDEII